MTIRHDSQGFLVGEPIDLGSAAEELSAIRKDTSAIRKSLDELLTRAPGANAERADGTPQVVVRRGDFANTRDEDYPETAKPVGRGNFGRGQGSSEVEALLSRFAHAPVGSAAVPSRSGARTEAPAGLGPGAPAAAQIVKELKATRLSMRKAVTPTRRDGRGRFVAAAPAADGGHAPSAGERDGLTQGSGGEIAGRIADAVKDAVHGAEDVDPAIKAFQEVAGPISQGFQLLGGLGRGDKQERWYRRILNVLSGFRKDESVANKKIDKRLKAIEDKPVGEEGKGGFFGLLLTAIAGLVPALLTGLSVLLGKIPVIGPTLAKGLSALARAPLFARMAAGAGATTAGVAKRPGLLSRLFGKAGAAGEVGAETAGVAKKAGGLAKLGRGVGAAAKRIPVLGSLIGLGLGALGSKSIESDATTTRKQKNEAQGRNWGGVAGGLTGAVVGQALIPIPVVGAVIGAVVGDWLGSNAGEIIGSKWEDFTGSLRTSWEEVRAVGLGTWDWIKDGWDGLTQRIGGVFDSVKVGLEKRWDQFVGTADTIINGVKTLFDNLYSALKTIPLIGPALQAAEGAARAAAEAARRAARAGTEKVKEVAVAAKETATVAAKKTTTAVAERAKAAAAGGAQLASDVAGAATHLVPQGLKDRIAARRTESLQKGYRTRQDFNGIDGAAGLSKYGTYTDAEADKVRSLKASGANTSAHLKGGMSGETRDKIAAYAKAYGLDPVMMQKVAAMESGGNAEAISSTGAIGIYQFTGKTASGVGIKDRFDADQNIEGGMKLAVANMDMLANAKLPVTAENLYMLHQLGPKAAFEVIRGADAGKSKADLSSSTQGAMNLNYGAKSKTAAEYIATNRKALDDRYARVVSPRASASPESTVARTKPVPARGNNPVRSPESGAVAVSSPKAGAKQIEVTRTGATVPSVPIPTVVTPAAPVSVSLAAPSVPAPPRVPAVEEPVQIPMPIASLDTKRPPIKVSLPWQDIGQDLRERGIAHIATGGLSSSSVG